MFTGQGSYSLYLGDSNSGRLIASGGQFTTDESHAFEINSAGLVMSPSLPSYVDYAQMPTDNPSQNPTPHSGYYMSTATGICQSNDESKPSWVQLVYTDFDECCQFSWNKQSCFAAKPLDADNPPAPSPTTFNVSPNKPEPTFPISTPQGEPVVISTPVSNSNSAFSFQPVTGVYTCKDAGMVCVIKCSSCETIKHVSSGMFVDVKENEDGSTFVYVTERGTDFHPNDPSQLTLVESVYSPSNMITCDKGCSCNPVNDKIQGCGQMPKPTEVENKPSPGQPMDVMNNGSACIGLPWLLAQCMIVLLVIAR